MRGAASPGQAPRASRRPAGSGACAGTLRPRRWPRTREVIVKPLLMLRGATVLPAWEVSHALQTSLGLVSLRYGCKLFKIHGPFAQVYAQRVFLCVRAFVESPLPHLK